jgi:hypothetical protein
VVEAKGGVGGGGLHHFASQQINGGGDGEIRVRFLGRRGGVVPVRLEDV